MSFFYLFLHRLILIGGIFLVFISEGRAQQLDAVSSPLAADTLRAMPGVVLDSVLVAPTAVDTKQWLLLNQDIQMELEGAMHNLYNFKFDKADRQFRSLRRRYPNHPMPYFLLGLSTWWKIMPGISTSQQYDKTFYAYLDTAITKAEALYIADEHNYEATFFLSAAYGFDARLHAERHDWRKATVSSKQSLTYLQKSRDANGLSPEFVFGEGLFNYYAVWIGQEYPWLRPVLLFFPKGDRATGLNQLDKVAQNGFYTATEARFFQARILGSARENQLDNALAASRSLAKDFPDNSCFQRMYATNCFAKAEFTDCEEVSRDMLAKINKGMVGYNGYAGRIAAYYLGYLEQYRYGRLDAARDYYQRCVVFCESVGLTQGGYYLFSLTNLARMAATAQNPPMARHYFKQVMDLAGRRSDLYQEARTYLRQHPTTASAPSFALGKE